MNEFLARAADLVLTGRFAVDEDQVYRHVPFKMRAGVTQFHLRYRYSDLIGPDPWLGGGNTLAIDVVDRRRHAPGPHGWSGSGRDAFTIGRGWATPPYRQGELEPGTWFELAGPHKIGWPGLDDRFETCLSPGFNDDRPDIGSMLPQPSSLVQSRR